MPIDLFTPINRENSRHPNFAAVLRDSDAVRAIMQD